MKVYANNWGGPRLGAGASQKKDKKKQVFIGIRESVIRNLGGEIGVKAILEKAVIAALKDYKDRLKAATKE